MDILAQIVDIYCYFCQIQTYKCLFFNKIYLFCMLNYRNIYCIMVIQYNIFTQSVGYIAKKDIVGVKGMG